MDYILSEKRQKVLEGIDKFGVVTSVQLEKFFPEIAKMTIFRTRQQVEEMGLAETKVFGRRKVLCITKKGSEYVGRISRGAGLSYSNLQHDLTTNDVIYSLLFDKNYSEKGFDFRTERELKEDIYLNASFDQLQQANFMRHISNEIPDFILENQEGNKLAFEVELSRKTNKRIQEKMKLYKSALNNGTYEKVFYVYKDEQIKKHVDVYAQGLNVPISFLSLKSLIKE